jgi:hypothetical protein
MVLCPVDMNNLLVAINNTTVIEEDIIFYHIPFFVPKLACIWRLNNKSYNKLDFVYYISRILDFDVFFSYLFNFIRVLEMVLEYYYYQYLPTPVVRICFWCETCENAVCVHTIGITPTSVSIIRARPVFNIKKINNFLFRYIF